MRKITLLITISFILTFVSLQSAAHAVTIGPEFVWTDNRGPNGFTPPGYYFVIGDVSITPSGPGTTVQATHIPSGSGPDYTLQYSPSPFYPNLYARIVPYSGQTGQWQYTATDGINSATNNTYILNDPQLLPLASNLAISGPSLTPTLTWDAFDSTVYPSVRNPPIVLGTDFYNLRVRIRLAQPGIPIIFDSPYYYTTKTSYNTPPGILEEDQNYLFDLMLFHFDTNIVFSLDPPSYITNSENVSETFVLYSTAPVPEPATMLLLGSGLLVLVGYGRKKFFKK